jgi:AcrR family transcriptional regulator
MDPAHSYREANRARLRDTLVTVARDLTVKNGWDKVRMADVARAAGVSRQTVYNEFEGRPGLAEALAMREIEQFTAAVRTELFRHGDNVEAAAHAAILHTLTAADGNPLIKAILTNVRGGADELLSFLTTRSDVLLAAACTVIEEWAAAFLPDKPAAVVARASDSIVRLAVSHIMLPAGTPAESAASLTEVFVRLLR